MNACIAPLHTAMHDETSQIGRISSMFSSMLHWLPRALMGVAASLGLVTVSLAAAPSALGFAEAGRTVLGADSSAASRFAVADVDGDGTDDFVFCGASLTADSSLMVIGKQSDNSIGFKQIRFLPDSGGISRVLRADVNGVVHILTVSKSGVVRDFANWPLTQVGTFTVPSEVFAAAAGDLYGNGGRNLVVLASNHLYAYSVGTGTLLWSYALSSAYDMTLAQLDADPALEVVVNSYPALVIDGATQATDWQYDGDFGYLLTSGHFNGDSTVQFAGVGSGNKFRLFHGDPWSAMWSSPAVPVGFGALTAANVDNNGRDVILSGDAQYGSVRVFDTQTQLQRFQAPNPGSVVYGIAAADVDRDGVPEIIFGTKQFNAKASIEIIDSHTGAVKWSFVPQAGLFSPVALGDVDGDGKTELVVATNSLCNSCSRPVLQIFDATSGVLKWQSTPAVLNGNDPFNIYVSRILLRPHATGNSMDIVLAGYTNYDGRIAIVDGLTHALVFQVYAYASGPLANRPIVDAVQMDFDNDGTQDIVAATLPASGQSTPSLVQVFSGTDGHLLTTFGQANPALSAIVGVLVTGPASDPNSRVIAVTRSSLVAYTVSTQQYDWSLLATADAASFLPQGTNGPELAVFQNNGSVTIYDAANQGYLRSFLLPAGLNALTPLQGDATHLIASSSGKLALIDTHSGELVASTDYLGTNLGAGNQIAQLPTAASEWRIAAGNLFGVIQENVEMISDAIFVSDFEESSSGKRH